VFLSIKQIEKVRGELLAGGYAADAPAAVVFHASWPDQRIVRGTLQTIARQAREAGFQAQALILIGQALDPAALDRAGDRTPARSKLYDPAFSHGYRAAAGEGQPATGWHEESARPVHEEDA
jgi:precorrin-4/cobalt-precorrin-4 C11-methyltransferase